MSLGVASTKGGCWATMMNKMIAAEKMSTDWPLYFYLRWISGAMYPIVPQ